MFYHVLSLIVFKESFTI